MSNKFKNTSGVCTNQHFLKQVNAYLVRNAEAIYEAYSSSFTITHNNKELLVTINSGIYVHQNNFEVIVTYNNKEVGYCCTLQSNYLNIEYRHN